MTWWAWFLCGILAGWAFVLLDLVFVLTTLILAANWIWGSGERERKAASKLKDKLEGTLHRN